MKLNRSYLLPLLTLSLTLGSQVFKAPVHAAPLAALLPTSDLVAYTNTSSLSNLMTEYRKANVELGQLSRDVKSATDMFNRLTAELDRVALASRSASPEAKAKLAARFDQLVGEIKQQKDKMMIATGNREGVVQRLASINTERKQMIESLMKDLNVLNTEANLIKANIRSLN